MQVHTQYKQHTQNPLRSLNPVTNLHEVDCSLCSSIKYGKIGQALDIEFQSEIFEEACCFSLRPAETRLKF